MRNFEENRKRLNFIIQFKTEFLVPFPGCRKVLGKMLDAIHCMK